MVQHNPEKETIIVQMDYKGDRSIRPFYCVRCGRCVCEITGDCRVIVPGEPDNETIGDLDLRNRAKCNGVIQLSPKYRIRCTAKYIFQ